MEDDRLFPRSRGQEWHKGHRSDEIFIAVSEALSKDSDVRKLGLELGVKSHDINRALATNWATGVKTSDGNLEMLMIWAKTVKQSEQIPTLRAALNKVGLVEVDETCLPSCHTGHVAAASTLTDASSQNPDSGGSEEGHVAAASTLTDASSQNPDSGGSEEDYEVKPDGTGRYTQEMKPVKPSKVKLNDKKRYQMNANPKGLLFLLNIKESRKGSDVDFDNIKHVFKEIGYEIEPHIDLRAEELKEQLQTFVDRERHKDMCSVVFVLMGHGNEREIICSDGKGVSRKFIKEKVCRMDSMREKPKMIFYHTCLKDAEQEETDDSESDFQTAEALDSKEEEETDEASGTCLDVESESDVLIVNATIEGRGAKRHRKTGTWFIGILCKVLLERAHKDDLEKMLKQVSGMLREKRDKKGKSQTSGFNNQGFPKYLYFLPKYPPQNVSP